MTMTKAQLADAIDEWEAKKATKAAKPTTMTLAQVQEIVRKGVARAMASPEERLTLAEKRAGVTRPGLAKGAKPTKQWPLDADRWAYKMLREHDKKIRIQQNARTV